MFGPLIFLVSSPPPDVPSVPLKQIPSSPSSVSLLLPPPFLCKPPPPTPLSVSRLLLLPLSFLRKPPPPPSPSSRVDSEKERAGGRSLYLIGGSWGWNVQWKRDEKSWKRIDIHLRRNGWECFFLSGGLFRNHWFLLLILIINPKWIFLKSVSFI